MNTQTKQMVTGARNAERKPVRVIETPVYNFDDLDDNAKEKARDWYRNGALNYDWWDSTYEDAETIGLRIKSFELDRGRHATGVFTEDAETVADLILKNHGKKCETYQTAKAFLNDAKELRKLNSYDDRIGELSDDFLKSLLEDYSIMLQHEYEYLLSDESVDENIRLNEYTFTEDGKREG